jgi:hypothetical protein
MNKASIDKCVNGYLLIVGVHKILISDESFNELKRHFVEFDDIELLQWKVNAGWNPRFHQDSWTQRKMA